jgi:replicative DNA helicase
VVDDLKIPSNPEAEKRVLSMAFNDKAAQVELAEKLKAEDFYHRPHRLIFEALMALSDKGQLVNRVSVQEELESRGIDVKTVGGVAYICELEAYEPGISGLDYYVGVVRDKARHRLMMTTAETILREGMSGGLQVDQYLDWAEQQVFKVSQTQTKPNYLQIGEIVTQLMMDLEAMRNSTKEAPAIRTGFIDLDGKLGGLHPTDLIILAARPAMGKTSLALNLATNAALEQNKAVVIFSLEMSSAQLATRIISALSRGRGHGGKGVSARVFREGKVTHADMEILSGVLPTIKGAPITVDDTAAISITELRARARRLKAEGRCDFIIIDYLQLMRGSGNTPSREQEVAEISRSLKALAKELNVPVMALSQLNRALESRSDKRPVMSDLRESGSIEQDSDVILFIFRDEVYTKEKTTKRGQADIIISKHRHGPIGEVSLYFDERYTQFSNIDTAHAVDPGRPE